MDSTDTEPDRLISLDRAFNFRDLGGYASSLGGHVRWRRIFRSDNLAALTDGDHRVLADLSIATVIDLRTPAEIERVGKIRPSVAYEYHHLPMSDVLPDTTDTRWSSAEYVASRYDEMLVGADFCMRTTLSIAADPRSYPLVFHCAAGKDRTGVLAALVLDIVGVERNVIVEDYVLTASRMDLILSRLQGGADAEARVAEIPQFLLRAEAVTMQTFLDQLHENHGGARGWALASGVSAASLEAMSTLLVAG